MNLINGVLVDLLLDAADSFREETRRVLQQYRTDRNRERELAKDYKDEEGRFRQAQGKLAAIAREGIAKAERVFSAKLEDIAKQMEGQLKKHLSMPVDSHFREKLSMLNEFSIQPERIEIEDLLQLNGGNQIGLTALQKTLEKVESSFVLNYHTTADFEKDLAEIRDITRNLKYIPTEYHSEGCEIYKGITADFVYPDGRVLGSGISYDSTTLLRNTLYFEICIEKIKALKDIWAADCSYGEADRTAEQEISDQKEMNEYLSDRGLPVKEIPDPKSGTTVEDNPENSEGIKRARELGKQTARENQVLAELKAAGHLL